MTMPVRIYLIIHI